MHDFDLAPSYELSGDYDETCPYQSIMAVRRLDGGAVMLCFLDLGRVPQAQRQVITARIKAHVRSTSARIVPIYSVQESADRSRIMAELHTGTAKPIRAIFLGEGVDTATFVSILEEFAYGVMELLEYYEQYGVVPTRVLVDASVLHPSDIFWLEERRILLPNPCVLGIEAELAVYQRPQDWDAYAAPELGLSDGSGDAYVSLSDLEKVIIWSFGVIIEELYGLFSKTLCASAQDVNDASSEAGMHREERRIYPHLKHIIYLCTARDPATRVSCAELCTHIEQLSDQVAAVEVVENSEHKNFEGVFTSDQRNQSVDSSDMETDDSADGYIPDENYQDEEDFHMLPKEYSSKSTSPARQFSVPETKQEVHTMYAKTHSSTHKIVVESECGNMYNTKNGLEATISPGDSMKSLIASSNPDPASAKFTAIKRSQHTLSHPFFGQAFVKGSGSVINNSESKAGGLESDEYKQYMDAAATGRSDILVMLLQHCARYQDASGTTALMAAVKARQTNCVLFLTTHEAGLQDNHGMTALMYAAINNDFFCIELLVKEECGMIDNTGMTALMYAVEYDHHELLPFLLEEAGMRDLKQRTAYDIAVKMKHMRCVEALEDTHRRIVGLNAHRVNAQGYTALMVSAIKGNAAEVQRLALLEAGATANDGITALHAAIMHNSYACIPPLLPYEAHISTATGLTPLQLAEKLDRPDCLRVLRGYTVQRRLPEGEATALMEYARVGDLKLVKQSLGDVCTARADGMTALMLAAKEGNYYVVECLAEHEQEIASLDGWTALMYAVSEGHTTCVECLLSEAGRFSSAGQTAYEIALDRGHKQCARLLLPHEEHLTIAHRVDELLALDNLEEAAELLTKPFVPSQALVDCIWTTSGGEFTIMWGLLRGNTDLELLARYLTVTQCVDLNDSELVEITLKQYKSRGTIQKDSEAIETLLNKALQSQKFLVISTICRHAIRNGLRVFVPKRLGKLGTSKTKLMLAAEWGDKEELIQSLGKLCHQHTASYAFYKQGGERRVKTISGASALMLAVGNRHKRCIPYLLPEMGLRDQITGATALILAVWMEDIEMVALLLPEVRIVDAGGTSPLAYAEKENSEGAKECARVIKRYLGTAGTRKRR